MAHPDLDRLLNEAISLARRHLAKYGQFLPFALSLDRAAKISLNTGWTGEGQPASEEIMTILVTGLQEQASQGALHATALCLDVRVTPPNRSRKTDAICVMLEHRNGETVSVYLPYRKGWFGGFRYGALFAGKAARQVFPGP